MPLLDEHINGGDVTEDSFQKFPGDSNCSGNRLPIFKVERVRLPSPVEIVSCSVSNNILVLGLHNQRLLKIDLNHPTEIEDLEIPRSKTSEKNIYKIFLDYTGQHLLVSTTAGENHYFHKKLSKPVKLSKVKGLVDCVGWNSDGTAFTTKEILIGFSSGILCELVLEPHEGFNRGGVERHYKQIMPMNKGVPIVGVHTYASLLDSKEKNILLATASTLCHFHGVAYQPSDGLSASSSIVQGDEKKCIESPATPKDLYVPSFATALSTGQSVGHFAWLAGSGITYGKVPVNLRGPCSLEDIQLLDMSLSESDSSIMNLGISEYHVITLCDNVVSAFNKETKRLVFREKLIDSGTCLGLVADLIQKTYWLYSQNELYEIVLTDESRDMWEIRLSRKDFEGAGAFATDQRQIDLIHQAHARSLLNEGKFSRAAELYATTSLPVDQVALLFIDLEQRDSLRTYLLGKLDTLRKGSEMQKTMLATWLLELYMNKLNALDDVQNVAGNLRKDTASITSLESKELNLEFPHFLSKYRWDLDREATYTLINSHGRQKELLMYANSILDYEYVVNYWVQQNQYGQALDVLVKHPNVELSYRLSSILLPEIPIETVEMWMRQTALDPRQLLPALLLYNDRYQIPIQENQAARYLAFTINHMNNRDPAVHNALLGIYAKDSAPDEQVILDFLRKHHNPPYFDLDFALRILKQYTRTGSCVHIYSSMSLYDQAVEWALIHDDLQLAVDVADRIEDNESLKKKLWLMIAKKTIAQPDGIAKAIEMSKNHHILRMEDLVPCFPDFTIIDDFKEEICEALEGYSRDIDHLRKEMDESCRTSDAIAQNIAKLENRFAIVQTDEQCYSCRLPLLSRQFYVFPCQHTFHGDCLTSAILSQASPGQRRRVNDLQTQILRLVADTGERQKNGRSPQELQDDLDEIVAAECVMCGSLMIKSIDSGFPSKDNQAEAASWAL